MRTRSLSLFVMIMFVVRVRFLGMPEEDGSDHDAGSKQEEAPAASEQPDQKAEEARRAAEEAEAAKAREEQEAQERAAAAGATGLQPVYFDFDKSFIRGDERRRHESKRRMAQGKSE